MGAWGVGNFENDTALDWVDSLEKYNDLTYIQETLENIDEDYIETDEGEILLVAIEAIASLKGNPSKNSYSESLHQWVELHSLEVPNDLLDRAKVLLDLMASDKSELKVLWEEAKQFDEWIEELKSLAQRIEHTLIVVKKRKKPSPKVFPIDETIIDILIQWADDNQIPELYKKDYSTIGFPRDKIEIRKLKSLEIKYVKLNSIPEALFELKNLEKLYLKNCELESFPKGLSKLTKLKRLSFEENKLNSLPEDLNQLKKLTMLDLSENNFKEIPSMVFELKSLTYLSINDMNLTKISKDIEKLINLKTLSLVGNPLKELPLEIGSLINLKELVAYDCKLDNIPESIGKLHKLKELEIEENNITTLPKELGELKKLKFCSAYDNPITSLPKECKWLVDKRKLELSNEDIKYY